MLLIGEYVGIVVFAMSGAITAINKKMDLFGVYILATVTAIGGGVIRDVTMDVGIPVFFYKYEYVALIFVASTIVILLKGRVRWTKIITVLDALGLAVFCIDGGTKALNMNVNFLAFLFFSLISCVGGSVLRDLLSHQIPAIFKKEIYALAALIGAIVFWFLVPLIGVQISTYICVALIFVLRIGTLVFKIDLPRI